MLKKSKITKKPSLPGYNFGQADETLTKGAATAGGLKKEEPAVEMSAFKMEDPNKKYQQLQKLFPNATSKDTIIAGRSMDSNIAKRMQNMNAMNAAASLNNATSGRVSNIYKAKKEEKNFYDNKNKQHINAAVYNKQELKNSFKMEDLSGDGKVTQKDVLIGKGVLNKDGSKANAMKPGYQMKYKMVNKEGFQMAGNPTKIAAFQKTGKTTKETAKSEKVENKTVSGGTETNYSGGGKFKNKEEKAWYDNQIKKRTDKGMSAEEAVQDYRNTFKIGEKKETKLPDKVVETVTKDPVYADKTMFNIDEQRERGQQSLLASRQSNREGLNKLVAQKAGLKTALKSNIDEVKNKSFDSRKDRREAIKEARQSKRQGMRSFRAGNFQGAQNVLKENKIFDTRGFDVGASDLARRQAMGIDKSVRYYDTQSALDKGVRAGGTYSDVARTSQSEADFSAEINPNSATNTLGNYSLFNNNLESGLKLPGNNMKKGNYMKPMQLSPKAMNYFNKKNKK